MRTLRATLVTLLLAANLPAQDTLPTNALTPEQQKALDMRLPELNRAALEPEERVPEKVEEGERVITSGLDGIFPEGLFIGTVSKVVKRTDSIFQHIEVTPEEDLKSLEEVIVVER